MLYTGVVWMNVVCVTDMINKSAQFSLAWSFYGDNYATYTTGIYLLSYLCGILNKYNWSSITYPIYGMVNYDTYTTTMYYICVLSCTISKLFNYCTRQWCMMYEKGDYLATTIYNVPVWKTLFHYIISDCWDTASVQNGHDSSKTWWTFSARSCSLPIVSIC